MNLFFPDAGLPTWVARALVGNFKYRLYTNNATPSAASVLGDFTEAAWGGYAAITVAAGDFSAASVSGHIATAIAPPISFLNSSGGTVTPYGYFITDTGGTILLGAARFDSAPLSVLNGAYQQVIPVIGEDSLYQ